MATVRAGLRFLAAADATQMPVQTQAECLQMLEQANAISTAARASILGAFAAGQGYSADADHSPRAWLINRTQITKGVAVAYIAISTAPGCCGEWLPALRSPASGTSSS
jgi:hypothetical protein